MVGHTGEDYLMTFSYMFYKETDWNLIGLSTDT